jgi:hypothetical protein
LANPAPRKRTVVWISVGVVSLIVTAAVVLLVSLAAGGTTGPTSSVSATTTTATCAGYSTSQTITIISGPVVVGTTGKVAAGVTCPDGHLGTILRYKFGEPIRIMVTVPDSRDTDGRRRKPEQQSGDADSVGRQIHWARLRLGLWAGGGEHPHGKRDAQRLRDSDVLRQHYGDLERGLLHRERPGSLGTAVSTKRI